MRIVKVDDKIKELRMIVEQATQELFRLQGRLQAFEDMEQNGVVEIQVPVKEEQEEEK